MIQRIQTLFLLIALILILSCFVMPIAVLSGANGDIYHYNFQGFIGFGGTVAGHWIKQYSMFISGIIISLISLISIFLYKRRILQMRLCIYNMILMAGMTFMFYYVVNNVKGQLSMVVQYKYPAIFPLIAAIFTYLAFRGIQKDDKLVKSYDRLR